VGTTLVERWVKCPACSPFPTDPWRDVARPLMVFEAAWWQRAGSKDQAIVTTFDLSVTRYYQILNAALDLPAALAEFPLVVNRLRRLRGRRFAW
jgi:hypothetical protein